MTITWIIIAATVLVSYKGFNDRDFFSKYLFSPYQVMQRKEWYRIFGHIFLHGDGMHLFFNMFVLFMFGKGIEERFAYHFGAMGSVFYILLYIGGAAFAALPGLKKHADNYYYTAIGASGAVAAVLFAFVLFNPMRDIYFFFIPFGIPAFIFGPLYLAAEYYLDKRGGDNIAHDAHFWGAIFGFIFPIALKPTLFLAFINRIIG